MAKFQSPLLGYNNNVRHKNRVFHIQTEDSGVNHPHIITHLFMDGGRILKSVKKSYAEHVGAEGMNDTVRGMMKDQHKAMFIALRDGQFDYLVDGGPPPAAAAPSATVAAAAEAPAAAPVAAAASASVASVAAAPLAAEASIAPVDAPASSDAPPTSPEPARTDIEPPPNTIEDKRRPVPSVLPAAPPPAAVAARAASAPPPPVAPVVRQVPGDDVPTTTRQPPEARPDAVAARAAKSPSGRELTLDLDALERATQERASSLFDTNDLPPPPKNLFSKEPGTGGIYRAVEADPRHDARAEHRPDPRHDAREEAGGGRAFSSEEPGSRGGKQAPAPSKTGEPSPKPGRVSTRVPASRPGEARYAPARPAAIFGSTQRPQPQALFNDELVSDKSLDEVILSYLAEDLEPPRRK